MMIVFGILIVTMMLLCVAAAADLIPTARLRRLAQRLLPQGLEELLQALPEEEHKTA